jgi:hypothetical protein
MGRLSRESSIAIVVSALIVGAMAVDHLIGTEDDDDPGLADPAAFLISVALSLTLVALLFGIVVRRAARDDPDRAARKAVICAVLALAAMALLFLGLPFALAGAGIALGLIAREGTKRGLATGAVVIGAVVITVGTAAYIGALLV